MSQINRRQALQLAGATVLSTQFTGCGALGRIIVSVPWTKIVSVVGAVVRIASHVLAITVALAGTDENEGTEESLEASLSDSQTSALKAGGTLFIRAIDGAEFEVPFTVEE